MFIIMNKLWNHPIFTIRLKIFNNVLILQEPYNYTPVLCYLNLSTLAECGYQYNISFKKLLFGSIDSQSLLALINIEIPIRNTRNNSCSTLLMNYLLTKRNSKFGSWKMYIMQKPSMQLKSLDQLSLHSTHLKQLTPFAVETYKLDLISYKMHNINNKYHVIMKTRDKKEYRPKSRR
ncbi:hypothetical protein AGLY_009052 [Aphis glycines]|uniref:Uncharacterized protein n=1 Tax=Aphis glycines TaxID=307491 RepID=A0A6G0TIQ4_APHGL|nr:hypothetical protein AGLY_009052 [Aphis glycines]